MCLSLPSGGVLAILCPSGVLEALDWVLAGCSGGVRQVVLSEKRGHFSDGKRSEGVILGKKALFWQLAAVKTDGKGVCATVSI